jgi:hypothetical protein
MTQDLAYKWFCPILQVRTLRHPCKARLAALRFKRSVASNAALYFNNYQCLECKGKKLVRLKGDTNGH